MVKFTAENSLSAVNFICNKKRQNLTIFLCQTLDRIDLMWYNGYEKVVFYVLNAYMLRCFLKNRLKKTV